jgi:hypothetical protein
MSTYKTVDDPLGVDGTEIYGVNNNGEIVGSYEDSSGDTNGFVDINGTFTTIDVPGASSTVVYGVNDSGEISGYSYTSGVGYQGFLDNHGTITTLNDPSNTAGTRAYGINNAGQVVGFYYGETNEGAPYGNGFLYSNGTYTTINDPDASVNYQNNAYGINNSGEIVGFYQDTAGATSNYTYDEYGYTESNGTYLRITAPDAAGPYGTLATGVNDSGVIVGNYYDSKFVDHGYVYEDGNYIILNEPSAGTGGYQGTYSEGINNSGEIVGYYVNSKGANEGFVLSPSIVVTPETQTVYAPLAMTSGPPTISTTGTLTTLTPSKGQIAFQDSDKTQTPTASIAMQNVTATNAMGETVALTADQIQSLENDFTIATVQSGAGAGTVNWTYDASSANIAPLPPDATVDVGATIDVSDNDGNSSHATVDVDLATPPSLLELAEMDDQAYSSAPAAVDDWIVLSKVINGEFEGVLYGNSDSPGGPNQIVLAIRGTVPPSLANAVETFKTLLTDIASFPSGTPTPGLNAILQGSAAMLSAAHAEYPNANFTITGHSLGGAAAQLVGDAANLTSLTFNGNGAESVAGSSAVEADLSPIDGIGALPSPPHINYRDYGDIVSETGTQTGSQMTIVPAKPTYTDELGNFLSAHTLTSVEQFLSESTTTLVSNYTEPLSVAAVPKLIFAVGEDLEGGEGERALHFALQNVSKGANNFIDPGGALFYQFSQALGSPAFASLTLPDDPSVASFEVWTANSAGVYGSPQTVSPGATLSLDNATGIELEALSASDVPEAFPNSYVFNVTFAGGGDVTANLDEDPGIPAAEAVADASSIEGVAGYQAEVYDTAANIQANSTGLAPLIASGHISALVATGVTGQAYEGYEYDFGAGGALTLTKLFYAAADQPYSSYEYDYAQGGDFVGSKFYYTGAAGANFSNYEYDYNGAGGLTRVAFAGDTVDPFSSYEYDYVGGVYSGSKFTYTNLPVGATYSSYEVDYNQANALTGEKFFFTNVTGQDYTGEEADSAASGNLTRVLLTGIEDKAYSSLELDYSAGAYEGYKAYYTGVTGQSFTNEEVDVSAGGQLEKVDYSGMTSTPYSSVEQDYAGSILSDDIYSFTDVKGQPYYAYQVEETPGGAGLQETLDLNNGGHDLIALASGQTLTSLGGDVMTGSATGSTTFLLNAIYGHDTIANLTSSDFVSMPDSEFTSFTAISGAATFGTGGAVIKAGDGDTLTLSGITTSAELHALSGDFTFHA